jgi:hypothetical protein
MTHYPNLGEVLGDSWGKEKGRVSAPFPVTLETVGQQLPALMSPDGPDLWYRTLDGGFELTMQ